MKINVKFHVLFGLSFSLFPMPEPDLVCNSCNSARSSLSRTCSNCTSEVCSLCVVYCVMCRVPFCDGCFLDGVGKICLEGGREVYRCDECEEN